MRIRLATVLIVPLLLFAGCLGTPAESASDETPDLEVERASTSTRVPPPSDGTRLVATPVKYAGRITEYVCTFGSVRHECNPLMNRGTNEFYEVPFEGNGQWIEGTVTLGDGVGKPPRVDIFLVHRTPGDEWEYVFPDDPYASGPSPVKFSWNLSDYPNEEFAFYVFGSHAVGTGVVGVSYAPSHPFGVEAVVTSAIS